MKTAIVLFVAGMAAISSAEGAAQRVDAAVQLLDRTTGTPIAGVIANAVQRKRSLTRGAGSAVRSVRPTRSF